MNREQTAKRTVLARDKRATCRNDTNQYGDDKNFRAHKRGRSAVGADENVRGRAVKRYKKKTVGKAENENDDVHRAKTMKKLKPTDWC